jgi:2-keto-3-deoxy-L-rhamnonate aldolase RhmA
MKRRLREDGEPALGAWLMSASPICAEALGWAGFDFLVVDWSIRRSTSAPRSRSCRR